MQISSRFTIAVHVLIAIETFKNDHKITSEFLASSANVNPTVIRRLLQQLKKAEIVTVKRGSGGADIEKSLTEITLLDVYNAVEPVENGQLFHFHENPNPECPIGKNIHKAMDSKLERVQKCMEDEMRKITIADVMSDIQSELKKN